MKKLLSVLALMLALVLTLSSCDLLQSDTSVDVNDEGYVVVNGIPTQYKVDDGKAPEGKEDVVTVVDGYIVVNGSEFSTVYCDPHSQRLWHSQ